MTPPRLRLTFPLLGLLLGLAGTTSGCGAHRLVRQGDAAMERGQPAAAERYYKRAITRRPQRESTRARLAQAYLVQDRPDLALPPAEVAAQGGVAGAEALVVEALLGLGHLDDAQERVERHLAEAPDDPTWLVFRAHVRLRRGDPTGAIAALDAALAHRAHPPELAFKAWLLARAGRMDEAVDVALQATRSSPEDVQVLADAAAVYLLAGRDDLRREIVLDVQSHRGGSAEELWTRSARRDGLGDREMALRYVAWAVACRPEDGEWLRRLGELLLERGMPGPAIHFLLLALAADPYGIDVQRQILNLDGAEVKTMIRNADEVCAVLERLAEAWRQQGQLPQAALVLERAAELRGSDALPAWVAAALAWLEAGDSSRALDLATFVVRKDPHFAPGQLAMARVHVVRGKADLALGYAQLAWKADPADPEVALLLGTLFEANGDRASARAVYEATLKRHPDEARVKARLERLAR